MIQAERKQETKKQQHKHHNHEEDDKSSVLSKIDSNNPEDLNLSEYCLSSDAETEKMDEDVIKQQDSEHVHLSELSRDPGLSPKSEVAGAPVSHRSEAPTMEKAAEKNDDEAVENEAERQQSPSKQESLSKQEPYKVDDKVPIEHNNRGLVSDETRTPESNNEQGEQTETKVPDRVQSEETHNEDSKPMKNEEDLPIEDELQSTKRSLDDREVISDSHFKKPKLPGNGSQDNDEDNDADEDEDDADEDDHEKQDLSGVNDKNRKHASSKSGAEQSPMEQEQLRLAALKEITDIECKFAELRQKLYENKLAKLQAEAQMCLEGSHPALQSYYQKIDSVRDYKLRRAYQRQKYELECIDKETRATRCFIHQDFFRKVTDLKHELLSNTTQKWYDINKERRDMDVIVPEVNYHVPVKLSGKTLSCITGYAAPAQQRREGEYLPEDLVCENINFQFRNNPVDKLEVIVDRMRFNNQLSDLEGLKRYFGGFPGAPSLSGLKDSEIFEDLQKLQHQL